MGVLSAWNDILNIILTIQSFPEQFTHSHLETLLKNHIFKNLEFNVGTLIHNYLLDFYIIWTLVTSVIYKITLNVIKYPNSLPEIGKRS